ncbi:MAG: hypothetical protein LPK47_02605 [Bacteroidota bacterium]|nr:hypothetical protein [Bacteroidota bacterium]
MNSNQVCNWGGCNLVSNGNFETIDNNAVLLNSSVWGHWPWGFSGVHQEIDIFCQWGNASAATPDAMVYGQDPNLQNFNPNLCSFPPQNVPFGNSCVNRSINTLTPNTTNDTKAAHIYLYDPKDEYREYIFSRLQADLEPGNIYFFKIDVDINEEREFLSNSLQILFPNPNLDVLNNPIQNNLLITNWGTPQVDLEKRYYNF